MPPRRARFLSCGGTLLLVAISAASVRAQSTVSTQVNSYTPIDEMEFGREAAAAVTERVPLLKEPDVSAFLAQTGKRLTAAIHDGLRQPGFAYHFAALHVREVTSFTFPGGPVFISARMIEIAPTEDALAGLLAHELAHVVLRHATAQVSAGEEYQIGTVTGRQLGLAVAAPRSGILERGVTFSTASYFLRFDKARESEADILAAQLMEAAGYDPSGLSSMAGALRGQGAPHGGLDWLGRHPGPRAADHAPGPAPSAQFASIQNRIRSIPTPERSIGHAPRADAPVGTGGIHVPTPDGQSRSVTAGDQLQLSVPANWHRLLVGNTVTFAPEGAYVALRDGPAAITHGFQVGVARSLTGDLRGDVTSLLTRLARSNPKLTWVPAFQRTRVAGHDALTTTLSNVSPVTHDFEMVTLTALRLSDDSFLYFLGVAPQIEASTYRGAFERIVESFVVLD